MYQIVTDSCCDLPYHVLAKEKVDFLSMNLQLNDQELVDDLGKTFNYDRYMNQLKMVRCLRHHKSMLADI